MNWGEKFHNAIWAMIIISQLARNTLSVFRAVDPHTITKLVQQNGHGGLSFAVEFSGFFGQKYDGQSRYVPLRRFSVLQLRRTTLGEINEILQDVYLVMTFEKTEEGWARSVNRPSQIAQDTGKPDSVNNKRTLCCGHHKADQAWCSKMWAEHHLAR